MFNWINKLARKWLPMGDSRADSLIIDFLMEWLEWATNNPVQDTALFNKGSGLCHCLRMWGSKKGYSFDEIRTMQNQLSYMFLDDNLSAVYPFGISRYISCAEKNTMHLSEKRRRWVKSRIERAINDY